MLSNDCVLKFNKHILKRYEHNLNGGTIILFDTDSFDIWFGNESANDLVRLVDGKTTIKDIYCKILPLYKDFNESEVIESFNSVIEELLDKKFLETV